MADFLANATEGAPDLQQGYSTAVGDAWAAFYASDCGADDPTCGSAQESLGRCACGAAAWAAAHGRSCTRWRSFLS